MNFGVYGILIVFGAFVVLLILNPNLSCFGKRIKSPLYPLLRKRSQRAPKRIQTESYGFDLGQGKSESPPVPQGGTQGKKPIPSQDYGFNLQDSKPEAPTDRSKPETD